MNIREFIDSLTPEQIEEGNKRQLEENRKVYEEFKAAYKKGICSLCTQPLDFFEESNPCFHWFLKPKGIKKKHFEKYLVQPIGFFQFDSYIRWIANLEVPLKNINDLKDEMNPAKITEYTVRYKNIEWSINIGKTDRQGHSNSKNADFPHFHLQMTVDGYVFLKFNDFHIPLSDQDVFMFRLVEEASDKVLWKNTYGAGMSILEDEEFLEEVDSLMKRTDDWDNAPFHTSTLIQMPEGETMSEETLENLFNESKETGTPVRHLIKRYYPQASIVTELRPGNSVPEISSRNKRK
ncbi:hypothetical protein I0P70_15010 [Pontibacter sp. FD36]|uniref:hypothetical protein n=1 Tax=Pontibacter sp. FD36 TaxID=2789860 RepID=UPI0018AAC1EE|nr:hypothetical protein [Pontibacter sp. FD36]MBF8964561.1 hypothetical protein [Pontibacter sp. FD36]